MAAKDLPTGCYKCGRPGHWSRDCTQQQAARDAAAKPKPTSDAAANPKPKATSDAAAKPKPKPTSDAAPPPPPAAAKTKRRKLTADLLLSDKGLGYVLEKLPQMVNIRGPGHEAEDLASLLNGYKSWHSAFFPSMPYKRFIGEVESLGSVKRVKLCLDDLRSRMASGHDLKGAMQATVNEGSLVEEERSSDERRAVDERQGDEEDALREQQAGGPAKTTQDKPKATLDEAQLQRMEANRRKALERRALAQQQQAAP